MTTPRIVPAVAFFISAGAYRAPGGADERPVGTEAPGVRKEAIRLSIGTVPEAPGWVTATVTNDGAADLLLNLGIMLGNGKEMFPSGITFECESADGKKLILVRGPSRVAGRLDPLIIPLPAAASWSIPLRLSEMAGGGPRGPERIGPGTYRVRAVLTGKPVAKGETNSDTEGLATWRFWTGTVRSGESTIEVR